MSDPVDWTRETEPGHRDVRNRVQEMVHLRAMHGALHRNEIVFFGFGDEGFHPSFDANDGERLFAYCRTNGKPLGSDGQIIVVANCRDQEYPEVWIDWPWGYRPSLKEYGGRSQSYPFIVGRRARLPLHPFQVRVFMV
jgi:hypothetical protein